MTSTPIQASRPAIDDAPRGRRLAEAAAGLLPGGVNSATRAVGAPFGFAAAEGAHVTDLDGRRYLDYHAAFGAILLGHNDPVVNDAIAASLGGVDLLGLGVSELEVELARRVVQVLPSAEMTIFTMSGSEAVGQAIRLARAVTGRSKLIKFQGGFHGSYDAVARNVMSTKEHAYGFDPLSAGILNGALESTLIAEFNDLDSVEAILSAQPGEVAAVILEPVLHNVGAVVPSAEFLDGLRRLTREHGALLIFDEVITGFRHALGGYQQLSGITPDLTTFGKGMANGVPIGGLAGRRDLMERFDGETGDVMLAGTFNGNPIGCAAAIATIDYLAAHPDFYERTWALGERARRGLQRIVDDLGIAAVAAGVGGVFALYFLDGEVAGYRDLLRNDGRAYAEFHRRMTAAGHLMLPIALKRNHISGAHTEADIDTTLNVAHDVLTGMRREGFVG
jgi:glutamate-1-semialdehyde 2,1-aminomutase